MTSLLYTFVPDDEYKLDWCKILFYSVVLMSFTMTVGYYLWSVKEGKRPMGWFGILFFTFLAFFYFSYFFILRVFPKKLYNKIMDVN